MRALWLDHGVDLDIDLGRVKSTYVKIIPGLQGCFQVEVAGLHFGVCQRDFPVPVDQGYRILHSSSTTFQVGEGNCHVRLQGPRFKMLDECAHLADCQLLPCLESARS